jgi:hypothetical protein
MPLDHEKERCKAKAKVKKQKANKKAIQTSFFGLGVRCVSFWFGLSLSLS